jgi:glycine cleavage system aminomethyltransferase T
VLAQLTDRDLGQGGSPYGSIIDIELDCGGTKVPISLFRISYVGDTGWEIYTDWEQRPDAVGQPHARRCRPRHPTHGRRRLRHVGPASRRATGSWAPSSKASTTPLEVGLARPRVKAADFIGREAYLAAREKGDPEIAVCTPHGRRPHRRPRSPEVHGWVVTSRS